MLAYLREVLGKRAMIEYGRRLHLHGTTIGVEARRRLVRSSNSSSCERMSSRFVMPSSRH
jgi:hypothetical protein